MGKIILRLLFVFMVIFVFHLFAEKVLAQTTYCGDGICNGSETNATCPGDCPSSTYCGDGICNGSETSSSCPADCPGGTGGCTSSTTCIPSPGPNCIADSAFCNVPTHTCMYTYSCTSNCTWSGWGSCDSSGYQERYGQGDCSTYYQIRQCAPDITGTGGGGGNTSCGDGSCNGSEDCSSCPTDCGSCQAYCGDGNCDPNETCQTCVHDCGSCNSAPSCNTTTPTNLTVTNLTANTWQLTWTPGTGGVDQGVYVGTNQAEVENDCPDAGSCIVDDNTVGSLTGSYTINNLLAGTVYYYRVETYAYPGCLADSDTLTGLSSCYTSPTNLNLQVGEMAPLTTLVTGSAAIGSVAYVKSGSFININPGTDNSPSPYYSTNVTGISVGSGTITSNVRDTTGATICSSESNVSVKQDPWWQVIGGDVTTNGDLDSSPPLTAGIYFDKVGSGGYPGIPMYGGNSNLTQSNVSAKGWLVGSEYTSTKVYNSAFLLSSMPSDITEANGTLTELGPTVTQSDFDNNQPDSAYGYYWYEYDPTWGTNSGADFKINDDLNFTDRKVILIVKGAETNIAGNINVTNGLGFFMLIAGADANGNKGDIIVDPKVGNGNSADLEGIYIADGQFETGTGGSRLWTRGSVAAYGGFNLQRDLGDRNADTPAEIFEYGPDLEMLYPEVLSTHSMNWQEVAP